MKINKLISQQMKLTKICEQNAEDNMQNSQKETIPEKDVWDFGNEFKCTVCDLSFIRQGCFKKHMKTVHQIKYKCNKCESAFETSFHLEKHLIKDHQSEMKFQCDMCSAHFLTKWRFDLHRKTHDQTNLRTCHYFNNDKNCPFVEFGCKFQHTISTLCTFRDKCQRKMCQHRH